MGTSDFGRAKKQELVFFNHKWWIMPSPLVFAIRELDTKGRKSLVLCTLVLLVDGIQRLVNSRTRPVGLWFYSIRFKSRGTLIDMIVPHKRTRICRIDCGCHASAVQFVVVVVIGGGKRLIEVPDLHHQQQKESHLDHPAERKTIGRCCRCRSGWR